MSDNKKKAKQDEEVEQVTDSASSAQISDQGDKKDLQIQILTEKVIEFEAKYKRALADYQNLERQTKEAHIRFAKLATQGFVEEMVEPYDHLKLAAAHLKDKGLDMVMTQFKGVFESQGLKEINPLGKMFDAATMEAIDTAEGKDGEVVKVVSSGYELNGFVVKPAKVIVGKRSS